MSREILHRVVVDVDHDVGRLDASLDEHQKLRPSGFGERLAPFGFSFRREPAIFHFVATGTSLGGGIMLAEFSTRIRAFAPLAQVCSGLFFLLALYTFTTFLRNAATRLEIIADGAMLTVRRRGLLRTTTDNLSADQIVGVIVAKDESGARSVVIAGPRHTALLDVHHARLLDPDTLPAWIADGVGLVARRATVRPPGDSCGETDGRVGTDA